MAESILSDAELIKRLGAHPELCIRMASLLLAVEDETGELTSADAAETRIIAQMRRTGNVALQAWSRRQVEQTSEATRQGDRGRLERKKTPLAQHLSSHRTRGAPVSKGHQTHPTFSQSARSRTLVSTCPSLSASKTIKFVACAPPNPLRNAASRALAAFVAEFDYFSDSQVMDNLVKHDGIVLDESTIGYITEGHARAIFEAAQRGTPSRPCPRSTSAAVIHVGEYRGAAASVNLFSREPCDFPSFRRRREINRLAREQIHPDPTGVGVQRMAKIGVSYAAARLVPRKPEQTLEDFLINRFGRELFQTFFKDYTEKVWGVPCAEISAEWGAQRIKGLSITKALLHAAREALGGAFIDVNNTETSLIEQFMYPKFGPGQLWEIVAEMIEKGGGEVRLNQRAVRIHREGFRVTGVDVENVLAGETYSVACTDLISTMPVNALLENMHPPAAAAPLAIAGALPHRDFITVGLLVPPMYAPAGARVGMPADNWIYTQEPDVKLGRLQIFNNWSPAMVRDHPKIFLGLEYFCTEGDELWNMPKDRYVSFAAAELEKIGLIKAREVEAGIVVKVPKAYPAYFGAFDQMPQLRAYCLQFTNLYLVGRNGMHRYNNQDHSMLSAKCAVECIIDPSKRREAIWEVNVEQDYHEEK